MVYQAITIETCGLLLKYLIILEKTSFQKKILILVIIIIVIIIIVIIIIVIIIILILIIPLSAFSKNDIY